MQLMRREMHARGVAGDDFDASPRRAGSELTEEELERIPLPFPENRRLSLMRFTSIFHPEMDFSSWGTDSRTEGKDGSAPGAATKTYET